jgi:hypothetical protein
MVLTSAGAESQMRLASRIWWWVFAVFHGSVLCYLGLTIETKCLTNSQLSVKLLGSAWDPAYEAYEATRGYEVTSSWEFLVVRRTVAHE